MNIILSSAPYTQAPGLLESIDKKTPLSDIPREIGWDVLKSMCKILDGVFDAFTQLLDLNFYNIPGVKDFVGKTFPIAWACFGIAIVIAAIALMINKDKLKISDFARSVIVSAALIVALPFSINVLTDMKNAGVTDMKQELKQNQTMGKTILASVTIDIDTSSDNKKVTTVMESNKNSYGLNITDTLDKSKWKYGLTTKQLDITNENVESSDYVQAIKSFFEISNEQYSSYMALSADQKIVYFKTNLQQRLANLKNNNQILQCNNLEDVCALYPSSLNQLIQENSDPMNIFGGDYVDPATNTMYYFYKLDDGEIEIPGKNLHLDFLEEYVYAYKYDFIMGLLLVIVTIIALFFAGLRVVGLMFDLLFNQFIAPIVFATDLQGSGRTKKTIENIVSSYLVFIIVLVLVKLYLEINLWAISNLTETKDIFLKLMILVGTAKGVIDGPDLIVKLLGVDAGVKSGAAAMLGIQSGLRVFSQVKNSGSNVVHAPGNAGKAIYNTATHANPIKNAQNFMRRSKLDREQLSQQWQAFKGNSNNTNSSSGSSFGSSPGDTATPLHKNSSSNSNNTSDQNSDTAEPRK